MSEHNFQNLVRIELSKLGYVVFRANVGKFKLEDGRWIDNGLPAGFSDLFDIKDGRVMFLELKFGKGKASKEQLNFISQMKKNGCVAGVVYSIADIHKLISGGVQL